MDYTIRTNLEGVAWEQVSALFEAVGWGKRPPETLERAFRKSTFVRIAYDGDRLIGCGRTVDDLDYCSNSVGASSGPARGGL